VNSHLLVGKVRHRRFMPLDYRFEHDVFYLALDLAELGEVDRRLRLFSYNRANVLSLLDRDHFDGGPIPAAVRAHLPCPSGTASNITMVAYPRVLGYVFNPVTFYLVHDGPVLRSAVAEVHNTHGERHVYPLAADGRSSRYWTSSAEKAFYVSPFIGPDASYRFSIEEPAGGLVIRIRESENGAPLLYADARLRRLPLTDANLARVLVRVPLVTLKTIGLIHWHAFRLWRARVPFHSHAGTAP
jgi:DUF1365 family protein